jgi:MFS family permease
MSVASNLSPVLFLTFNSLYGISYSLLGLLVLVNFVTQLSVDVIFSFFSYKFNIPRTVKCMPIIAAVGILVYALWPFLMPNHVYLGLVIGTVIISASAGLGEVLISPVIAALPSDNPDKEMSKLHSVYAWGVVGVIIVSTVFLLLFGKERWQYLALLMLAVPLVSAALFLGSDIPKMDTPERVSGVFEMLRSRGVWLCFIAIFLAGAAECTMGQWSSAYIEGALGIPKIWGDIFGVALFSATLGLGRTLHSKFGGDIGKVLTFGAIGATVCYFAAAVTPIYWVGLVACALTGLFVSMLWPGNLLVASDKFPQGGVFIYAMMAAGGDLGASVGPQLVGIITDSVIAAPSAVSLAERLGLTVSELGMKLGMLSGMIFPLIAIFVYLYIWKKSKKRNHQ